MTVVAVKRCQHTALRHLAWSIWLNYDPDKCWMAMYTCYYDASSAQDSATKPLVVVGLLSTMKKWLKCENEWDAVLGEFELPYLHMKEFAHSVGPFAALKNDLDKRAEFLAGLIGVLKRRVNIIFQYRLVPEVFHKFDHEYTLREALGNPYAFTTMATIRLANEWFESHYPNDQIEHVVEKGDIGQAQLLAQFAGLPYAPTLKPKIEPKTQRHLVPFQAVDLLAYEAYLNINRHLEGKKQVLRKSLAELRKIPHCARLCDDEVMQNVIAQNPEALVKRSESRARPLR